jgi:hypothetical protein
MMDAGEAALLENRVGLGVLLTERTARNAMMPEKLVDLHRVAIRGFPWSLLGSSVLPERPTRRNAGRLTPSDRPVKMSSRTN